MTVPEPSLDAVEHRATFTGEGRTGPRRSLPRWFSPPRRARSARQARAREASPARHQRAECPLPRPSGERDAGLVPGACLARRAAAPARASKASTGPGVKRPECQAFKRPLCAPAVSGKTASSPRRGEKPAPPLRGPGRGERARPSAPVGPRWRGRCRERSEPQ